jgi:hypothetical protein
MLIVTVALGSSGLPSATPSALPPPPEPLLLDEQAAAPNATAAANANAAAFLRCCLAEICADIYVLPERNLGTEPCPRSSEVTVAMATTACKILMELRKDTT